MAHEIRRTISPYDITAADNSGAVISHPILKSNNYDEWACGFKTALRSRKKFGFLDGTILQPPVHSPDLEDWWTINALIVSWMKMTIDPALLTNISHRDVARDLWEHIRKRFSITNGPRNQKMKADLACCKQQSMTVEEYYGKLNKIWDNINNYRPLRTCSCGKCTCNLGVQQEKDRENDKVHQFLFGLNDGQFHSIKSSIISRDPLPGLEEVYNIVRQEEDMLQNNRLKEERPEGTAFATYARPRFRTEEREKYDICKHCNRGGHAPEQCFVVVGYPEWWGSRPIGKLQTNYTNSRGRGRTGFGAGNSRGATYANDVTTGATPQEHVNRVITEADRDVVTGLTDDQWRGVLQLLNAKDGAGTSTKTPIAETLTGNVSLTSWILDTGASHHMTGKFHLLTDIRNISPVIIIMADGNKRVAVQEGTVLLGSQMVLKSVFYVPELQSDLISVGQMMDENKCVIQLTDHFLVIQDRITRTVTGVGKQTNGSFYFRSNDPARALKTDVQASYELWHMRLGHASEQVVTSLPHIQFSSDNKVSKQVCDICMRAKQTRDTFPLSSNKSLGIFQLLHCDVWGPYRTPSYSGARYFLTIVDDFSRGVWLYLMVDKPCFPYISK